MTSDALRKLSPPAVGKIYGVSPERVIGWIRTGELVAIDVSSKPGVGRPRYRIDVLDLAAFDAARQVVSVVKPTRRRRKDDTVIQFFK